MKYRAIKDRIVIQYEEQSETYAGSIIIKHPNEDMGQRSHVATVVSVGPDVPDLAVGDRVVLERSSHTLCLLNKSERLWSASIDDVVMVIEPDTDVDLPTPAYLI